MPFLRGGLGDGGLCGLCGLCGLSGRGRDRRPPLGLTVLHRREKRATAGPARGMLVPVSDGAAR
jgi:hypothetical protein